MVSKQNLFSFNPGEFARSLQFGDDASIGQIARESKASQLDDPVPAVTPATFAEEPAAAFAPAAPAPIALAPVAPVAPAAVRQSLVPLAQQQPYFNQYFASRYFGYPQQQQLFYRY